MQKSNEHLNLSDKREIGTQIGVDAMLDIASDVIADTTLDTAIQSGLNLIPIVGNALSTAYFSTKQAKQFKRIEDFYLRLSRELEDVSTKIINIENQYEEGLVSLTEQLNNYVENEHLSQKIDCYINYMKNLLYNKVTPSNFDKKKTFLDTISIMSILEIDILHLLYDNGALSKNSVGVNVSYIECENIYATVGAISKLKSYGFISARQNKIDIGGQNELNDIIAINDYGLEFVNFVLNS